jgi:calcium-dependent protein kinase
MKTSETTTTTSNFILGDESHRDIKLYYEITTEELGKGSYGIVHLGRLRGTNLRRAIKIINKAKVSNVERFKLEIEIMMKLDHPSILRLYDYFEDANNVYLVLELCTGGELFDRIIANKYFGEDEARIIFRQIMKAIYYCHLNGVCHRDLKPENFIMVSKHDQFTLKAIDFGLSRTFNNAQDIPQEPLTPLTPMTPSRLSDVNTPNRVRRQTRAVLKTKAGTPFYIAPEVLTGNYNEKCDVWSGGVILYILLCGYPPFYGENNKEILEAVKKGKLDFSSSEWKDKSKQSIDLVKRMIINHEIRLFADEVLKHPWMHFKNAKIDTAKVKEIYTNMKQYSQLNLLRKTVIYFIARNMYEEEFIKLHPYFDFFDPKDMGNITLENFKTIAKSTLNIPEKEADEVFAGLDIFNNKYISYSQFTASAINFRDFMVDKKLNVFFSLCDMERDGKLTLAELDNFLSKQFKYKSNIPNKFKFVVINEFTDMKLQNLSFADFAKVFAKVA